ncbi:MAG: tRNA uridine-5-carboxymethylaminomethyl(34) synthesis GTPase MnmE [Candidatus Competibacteraceae bacterium]|nr:tRNA uridine-5-carboxymethylaminomethyl(34) synthesis GTPase MnmE [Candidatus Competibacteraceae bacterium]
MLMDQDTIAAIATPPGQGGVGIIRISGPRVPEIAKILLGRLPEPRRAVFCPFRNDQGQPIDEGLLLYFAAPYSFTGEAVLELHGHGGPVVLDLLLARVLELGARPARPGEFSQRAFLNDKLDLAQAEAVADLIESGTAAAVRAAVSSLQGAFSERVHTLVEGLVQLRIYVESAIDFPEEEIDFLADSRLVTRLLDLEEQLARLRAGAFQGQLLRDGMTVVIAGRPNAGKSSLLNRLAGREAAIVTDIPGTTRDVLREQISIDGMPLHVVDTAGLRDSADRVEQEGIRRAWREIKGADRILLVVDDRLGLSDEDRGLLEQLPTHGNVTVIHNKIDLSEGRPGLGQGDGYKGVWLSARTGAGFDTLTDHLKDCMGFRQAGEGAFMARRRHLEALARTARHLEQARFQLQDNRAGELAAEDLRAAQEALGEITGEFTSDDLLGRIFSTFCIGK